jgi:hypothetical protein
MTIKRSQSFPRRRFLRGAGASLALPMLASLTPRNSIGAAAKKNAAKDASQYASRFVCVMPEYGIHRESLIPKAAGPIAKLPAPAASLNPYKKDLTIVSGLDHPEVGGGHGCSATFLNGMKMTMTGGDRRKMMSFDQYLVHKKAPDTRFLSLGTGNGGPISYNSKGVAIPKDGSPQRLFAKLFGETSTKAKAIRRQSLKVNGSILDAVREDSQSLRGQLGAVDQRKFDEYLNAVRETEQKLERRSAWVEKPKPKAPFDPLQLEGPDGDSRNNNEIFYDILALALQTDSTRFANFQMGGGNGFLPIPGCTMAYHSMTHHGRKPEHIRQLQLVDAWRFKHFAGFLKRLKTIRDANDRPLLDTTVVLFGSGMADASVHSSRNTPIMVAGGGFKHGHHHAMPNGTKAGEKDTPLCNLYVSIANRMGVETDRFSTSGGNMNHLLA